MVAHLLHDRQTVRVRQVEVEQNQVRRPTAGEPKGLLRIPCAHGAVTLLPQKRGDETPNRGMVLEHQHHLPTRRGTDAPVVLRT